MFWVTFSRNEPFDESTFVCNWMEYVSSIITLHVTLKTKQDECEKFLHTDIMICYPYPTPLPQPKFTYSKIYPLEADTLPYRLLLRVQKLTISNFAESTTRPEKVSSPWTPSVVSSLSCWLPSLMRNLMESLRNLMKMDQVSCQLLFLFSLAGLGCNNGW